MDITVYLPDEIGTWAKEARLNLSAMLRNAVVEEKAQLEAINTALEGAQEQRIKIEDADGRIYTARFTGTLIAEGRDCTFYLKDDGELLQHDTFNQKYDLIQENWDEALRDALANDEYIEACHALGLDPVVDV